MYVSNLSWKNHILHLVPSPRLPTGGLLIRKKWLDLIVALLKRMEIRTYACPLKYIGVPIALIQTNYYGYQLVRASCIITGCISLTPVLFTEFYPLHQVTPEDLAVLGYEKKQLYGWQLSCVTALDPTMISANSALTWRNLTDDHIVHDVFIDE